MKEYNRTSFLETVKEQIRCKKIQESLAEEIEDHMNDQKEAYLLEGYEEEEAERKALEQMGDPVDIGVRLDRVHRPKIEWSVLSLIFILASLGLVIYYFLPSMGMVNGEKVFLSHALFWKQFQSLGIGFVILSVVYFFDYSVLSRYIISIWCIFWVAVVLVWYSISSDYLLSLEIAYAFAVAGIPLYGAILYAQRERGAQGLLHSLFLFGVPALLLCTMSVYACAFFSLCCYCMLFIACKKKWFHLTKERDFFYFLMLHGMIAVAGVLFFVFNYASIQYHLTIIFHRLHPYEDPTGAGYLTIRIKELVQNAHLFGVSSVENHPFSGADYLITNVIYRYGMIPGAILMSIVLFFIGKLFYISAHQKNQLGMMISFGCTFALAFEAFFYMTANIGIGVITPKSLPFVSNNMFYMVSNMVLAGFILSIYRNTNLIVERKGKKDKQQNCKAKGI